MTKEFERRTRSGQAQWNFQTQRTWSPLMISNSTRQIAKNLVVDHVSDDPLRALVDACISSVAVLDESGKILYSSKVWRLFQQGAVPEPEHFEVAPRYFEN